MHWQHLYFVTGTTLSYLMNSVISFYVVCFCFTFFYAIYSLFYVYYTLFICFSEQPAWYFLSIRGNKMTFAFIGFMIIGRGNNASDEFAIEQPTLKTYRYLKKWNFMHCLILFFAEKKFLRESFTTRIVRPATINDTYPWSRLWWYLLCNYSPPLSFSIFTDTNKIKQHGRIFALTFSPKMATKSIRALWEQKQLTVTALSYSWT